MLGVEAHFAASYLVPLDGQGQGAFGGLLRWFWPWAYGDGGPLGAITPASGFPISGFFLAAVRCVVCALAALAAAGIWVPPGSSQSPGRPPSPMSEEHRLGSDT